ncbi:MAG: hypothetical protein O0X96_05770 [Methanocorpusculum sp.]|nr:hypothetical protein [Methanocorpusculum sp.]
MSSSKRIYNRLKERLTRNNLESTWIDELTPEQAERLAYALTYGRFPDDGEDTK